MKFDRLNGIFFIVVSDIFQMNRPLQMQYRNLFNIFAIFQKQIICLDISMSVDKCIMLDKDKKHCQYNMSLYTKGYKVRGGKFIEQ